MKNYTYAGRQSGDRITVLVIDKGVQGRMLPIAPSQAVFNHSSEFNWGYGGSGPSQLALAILLHHVGETPLEERVLPDTAPSQALRFYQMFKNDFVSQWGNNWEIKSSEIQGWLRQVVAQAETKRKEYSYSPVFPPNLAPQGGTTIIQG